MSFDEEFDEKVSAYESELIGRIFPSILPFMYDLEEESRSLIRDTAEIVQSSGGRLGKLALTWIQSPFCIAGVDAFMEVFASIDYPVERVDPLVFATYVLENELSQLPTWMIQFCTFIVQKSSFIRNAVRGFPGVPLQTTLLQHEMMFLGQQYMGEHHEYVKKYRGITAAYIEETVHPGSFLYPSEDSFAGYYHSYFRRMDYFALFRIWEDEVDHKQEPGSRMALYKFASYYGAQVIGYPVDTYINEILGRDELEDIDRAMQIMDFNNLDEDDAQWLSDVATSFVLNVYSASLRSLVYALTTARAYTVNTRDILTARQELPMLDRAERGVFMQVMLTFFSDQRKLPSTEQEVYSLVKGIVLHWVNMRAVRRSGLGPDHHPPKWLPREWIGITEFLYNAMSIPGFRGPPPEYIPLMRVPQNYLLNIPPIMNESVDYHRYFNHDVQGMDVVIEYVPQFMLPIFLRGIVDYDSFWKVFGIRPPPAGSEDEVVVRSIFGSVPN